MKNLDYTRGMAMPAIIAIIAIILIGGGIWYANTTSDEGMMEKKAEDMMKDGEAMMEDGEAMMEDGDAMRREAESMLDGKKEGEAMMEDGHSGDAMMEEEGAMMEGGATGSVSFKGEVLAGSTSPLLDFNESDYKKALASDKLVTLYFYANWCPSCRIEFPKMQSAFNKLSGDNVIGFRVNYNDNQTDSAEKGLAKEFGVAYQHTKVFVKNGERILKSPETWDEARYTSEINKFLTQ